MLAKAGSGVAGIDLVNLANLTNACRFSLVNSGNRAYFRSLTDTGSERFADLLSLNLNTGYVGAASMTRFLAFMYMRVRWRPMRQQVSPSSNLVRVMPFFSF